MSWVKSPPVVICTFLWIGFVCAISFLEAWLKFQAPGITVPLGLGIGRLVFAALNKIEWVFALAIIIFSFWDKEKYGSIYFISLGIAVLVLLLQTFWLLPALDVRAEMHLNNENVPPSNLHFYYVTAEVLKVVNLAVFGITLFKKTENINGLV